MYFMFISKLYFSLLKYSIALLLIFFWYTIGFYDRTHIRIKSFNIGNSINKFLKSNLTDKYVFLDNKYIKFLINSNILRQITLIFDSLSGFFEGINNEDIIINVNNNKMYINEEIQLVNNHENNIDNNIDNNLENNLENFDIGTSYEIKDNNEIFNKKFININDEQTIQNLEINKEKNENFPNELIVNPKKKVIIKITKKKN